MDQLRRLAAMGAHNIMKYHHVGIPTSGSFEGEIPLPHLKLTVSDHRNNPFGIQWQRYLEGCPIRIL